MIYVHTKYTYANVTSSTTYTLSNNQIKLNKTTYFHVLPTCYSRVTNVLLQNI